MCIYFELNFYFDSEQSDPAVCAICKIGDGVSLSTLGERGCKGINAAYDEKGIFNLFRLQISYQNIQTA